MGRFGSRGSSGDRVSRTHPLGRSFYFHFKLSNYKKVNPANFKDENGDWMKRCEDQTFMLPIIHVAHKNNEFTHFFTKPMLLVQGISRNRRGSPPVSDEFRKVYKE